jgi:Uma2 family endonuclease
MQLETMLTVDEFARLPRTSGERLELSRGMLVRQPRPGALHATAAARIFVALRHHASSTGADVLFDTRFVLAEEPPTVRGPDVALRTGGPPDARANGVVHGSPDLAVEITFTSDQARPAEMLEKVFEYLDAGTTLVWVVDLAARSITQYQRDADPIVYLEGDVIRGSGMLRDFVTPASALLA